MISILVIPLINEIIIYVVIHGISMFILIECKMIIVAMLFHMGREGARSQELVVAVPADVRSFTFVSFFVLLKETPCRKAIIAVSKITFEWFLPIMNPHMSQKISLLPKSLFTSILRTHERPLPSL